MKPYISIIVPFWNAATTLKRCIDSIVEQTYENWELILVDDGSTDESNKICSQCMKNNKKIHLLCRNHEGVAAARNAGIDKAHGERLCFIDADDSVEIDFLEKLCSHSDADLVVCGYKVDEYDNEGKLLSSTSHVEQNLTRVDFENRLLLESAFTSGIMHINCNKLFRLDIIQKQCIRYLPYSVNEDFIFILEYLKLAKTIAFVPYALYHWIRVSGIVTGVASVPENLLQIYELSHQLLGEYLKDESVTNRIAYQSYDLIRYKYMSLLSQGIISWKCCFNGLQTLHSSKRVRQAFRAYNPHSVGEHVFYWLHRLGWFRLSYIIQKCINL